MIRATDQYWTLDVAYDPDTGVGPPGEHQIAGIGSPEIARLLDLLRNCIGTAVRPLERGGPVVRLDVASERGVGRCLGVGGGRRFTHKPKIPPPLARGTPHVEVWGMKAAVFHRHGGPEVLRIEDVPDPEPGPGEVRIRVRAASLNHLDIWVRKGLPFELLMPHIGGSDMAGEVDLLGPGVHGVKLGTRVVVDPSLGYDWYSGVSQGPNLPQSELSILGEQTQGGFAEYAVVPVDNLLQVPDSVSFELAAAAGLVSVTAWHALMSRARLQPGEHVLVTGASGGVSTMAIQIAKLAGAKVSALTSVGNVERVRALGADVVYDRTEGDWARALWNDTDKQGVDVVLDSVGAALWKACVKALAPMGRLVTYGATTGPAAQADIRLLFWKQLSILGSTMGTPDEFRRVMKLVFEGRIEPPIYEVLPLVDIQRGHEILEGGGVFGKLVVTP